MKEKDKKRCGRAIVNERRRGMKSKTSVCLCVCATQGKRGNVLRREGEVVELKHTSRRSQNVSKSLSLKFVNLYFKPQSNSNLLI